MSNVEKFRILTNKCFCLNHVRLLCSAIVNYSEICDFIDKKLKINVQYAKLGDLSKTCAASDDINNNLHLAGKYARIFVRGHAFSVFYTLIKHEFLTNESARSLLSIF